MASVKKTPKPSKTKQASSGTSKAKTSRQSAGVKVKRAAAARGAAAKKPTAAKSSRAVKTKAKVSLAGRGSSQGAAASASKRASPDRAAARSAARASKTVTASGRVKLAAARSEGVERKSAASRKITKSSLTKSSLTKAGPASGKALRPKQAPAPANAEKSHQSKKKASLPPSRTAAVRPERSLAAKALPPAPAEGRVSAPAPQKTAANKSAAAAILALKRSQQTESSPAAQPGTLTTKTTHSLSTSNAAPEEPITVIKKTHEVISSAPQANPIQRMVKTTASPAEKKTASARPSPSGGPPAAPAAGPAREAVAAARAESPAPKQAKNASGQRQAFKLNEFVVYPAHGVGQIIAIEEQEVAGFKLELFVISFVKDKMILKVPTTKAASVGMRKLADAGAVKTALETLAGRARIKRTMWSRRAQEYEAKINSGDLNAIAEVVRDLYRSESQPEQSYSERQLYEAALDRMAREIVVVQKITETESLKVIEAQLQKGPRRGKIEESEPDEADIEEAA